MTDGRATMAWPLEWLRGPATVSNGLVMLDPARAESYMLTGTGDLVDDLTNIRTASDAIRFVGKYGLLRSSPGSGEFSEPFRDWKSTARGLRGIYGLYEALQRSVRDPRDKAAHRDIRDRIVPVTRILTAEQLKELAVGDLQTEASYTISQAVTEGLEGVEERVAPAVALIGEADGSHGQPGVFLFAPGARDLVGAAYHELAMLLVSRRPVRQCEECGRVFAVRDQRQRFCSKTCGARVRYQRMAARKAQPKGENDG